MSLSPLKHQGNPPRGPSFVCPGGGSVGPRSPRPAAPDAPGQLGVSRAPRAQHLAGAAHRVGSASRLQAGSLHFPGRGSNNKPSGAAARAPLPRDVPRLPSNPPAGVTKAGARHAPALRPPRARHGMTRESCTPTALRVALLRPQQPPPHSPRRSDGRQRGGEARWPGQPGSPWGRGSGLGWSRAVSPAGTQPPPIAQSLCAK